MAIMEYIVQFVKDSWAFLAALGGIAGLIYKYLIKPAVDRNAEEKKKLREQLKEMSDCIAALQKAVKEVGTDVGYLQHDRLQQGHDHWMKRGYCPPGDKENLIDMYDRYISQDRNSLYKSYKQDLLELPPTPDGHWGARVNP